MKKSSFIEKYINFLKFYTNIDKNTEKIIYSMEKEKSESFRYNPNEKIDEEDTNSKIIFQIEFDNLYFDEILDLLYKSSNLITEIFGTHYFCPTPNGDEILLLTDIGSEFYKISRLKNIEPGIFVEKNLSYNKDQKTFFEILETHKSEKAIYQLTKSINFRKLIFTNLIFQKTTISISTNHFTDKSSLLTVSIDTNEYITEEKQKEQFDKIQDYLFNDLFKEYKDKFNFDSKSYVYNLKN